jgi:hypothetical protein
MERANRDSRRNILRFDPPLPLTDQKILARIAPTLKSGGTALILQETGMQLQIVAVALLDSHESQCALFGMPRTGYSPEGLFIEILGPGHLRVSEGHAAYTLWANEIMVHESLNAVEPVRAWLHEVSIALFDRASHRSGWDPERGFLDKPMLVHKSPHPDVAVLWSWILREGMRIRHGGAFVIIPEAKQARIDIKFQLKPFDLGNEVIDLWLWHCRLFTSESKSELETSVEGKGSQLNRLFALRRSIGALSATDGCVVFDRKMVLHGFGGHIENRPLRDLSRTYIDLSRNEEVSRDKLLSRYGERHGSACNLCEQVPGSNRVRDFSGRRPSHLRR